MRERVFTIVGFLFLCTLALAADVSEDFSAAVRVAQKDFPAAIASSDAAAVGSMYAQDAIAFPPNSDMVKGREAIQAFWKGFIDAKMTAQLEVVETESDGDIGVEVGKYTIMDPAGKTVDQGKYVVVWKKGEGGWKLYRDIWNTSMAAPGQ
ncbi:MAG TPA: SgcJ/EcaC family oxidoreductase [Acidobacteriota bacterium]|nr:SgcJ/EcaC family oxidoreductase [Acidobacteriota bacterium]